MTDNAREQALAVPNVRLFMAFRTLFNARFYYPVFMILFLDYGISLEQFGILNAVWAAAIVFLEVPSGALADIVGRKRLIVFAGLLMVLEMLILSLLSAGSSWVMPAMVLNRILSGAAEASASGADEALAYDSLKERGLEEQWPMVLERLMKISGLAMLVAMVTGAAVYDPGVFNTVSQWLGQPLEWTKANTFRIPMWLNLLTALGTLIVALKLIEKRPETDEKTGVGAAFSQTFKAGQWILKSPVVFMVILVGIAFDHVVRQLMVLSSEIFNLIGIPELLFGFISAAFAIVGLALANVARRLAMDFSPLFNTVLIASLILLGLAGTAFMIPYWGLLFFFLLAAAMRFMNFLLSHYLNQLVSSEMRATVLSFKGLAMNLAYGAIGLLYTALIAALRSGQDVALVDRGAIFKESMKYFPGYFAAIFALAVLIGLWRLRGETRLRAVGGFRSEAVEAQ